MTRNSKYNDLLNAAIFIVKEQGIESLTLDAVAKQAGMSKGGLLYHFPTKEALIESVVSSMTQNFSHNLNSRITHDSNEKGKWSRAYLEQTVTDLKLDNSLGEALIIALFANPQLLKEMQDSYASWQQQIVQDGIDPVDATMVRLIADGLWFSEVFKLGTVDEELRNQIVKRAIELTNKGIED